MARLARSVSLQLGVTAISDLGSFIGRASIGDASQDRTRHGAGDILLIESRELFVTRRGFESGEGLRNSFLLQKPFLRQHSICEVSSAPLCQ